MNTDSLTSNFSKIGARLRVNTDSDGRRLENGFALDIKNDDEGDYFEICVAPQRAQGTEVSIMQSRPKERHVLLMVRQDGEINRFLCGHDERAWFVAAVPGNASSVEGAKEALKPRIVRRLQDQLKIRPRDRNRRRNEAFRRQGEWFFIPRPRIGFGGMLILRHEPIRRSDGSKPHIVEELYRERGQPAYVCDQLDYAASEELYRRMIQQKPSRKAWNWQRTFVNAHVYARGRVRHSDHATIRLPYWHEVVMNTENETPAMRRVMFLD